MKIKHVNIPAMLAIAFGVAVIGELQSLPSRIVAEQVQIQQKQAAVVQSGLKMLFSGKDSPKDTL